MRGFLVLLSLLATPFSFGLDGYGAFAPIEKVRGVIVNQYPVIETSAGGDSNCVIVFEGNRRAELKVLARDENSEMSLLLPDGSLVRWRFPKDLWPHLNTVYAACLNEDDIPDIVVQLRNTGCGLAAVRSDVIFLLSKGKGYEALLTETYDLGPGDFVDYYRDGKCEFVQTRSIWAGVSKDGREHMYWVHRLLKFEGTCLVSCADFKTRWRMYTFQPNHFETELLTEVQKSKAWAEELARIPMQKLETLK